MVQFNVRNVILLLCCISCAPTANSYSTHVMKINATEREPRDNYSKIAGDDEQEEKAEFFLPDLEDFEPLIEGIGSEVCRKDALLLMGAVRKREIWAMRMFDASAKFPVGALYGSFYQLGNFDECIDARRPDEYVTENMFLGKYCLADISINPSDDGERIARSYGNTEVRNRREFNKTLHWAICVPSTCSNKDAEYFLHAIFSSVISHHNVSVVVPQIKCHVEEPAPLTKLEIVYGVLLGVFMVLILLSTVYHFIYIQRRKTDVNYTVEGARNKQNGTLHEVLLLFSVIKNVKKILHIQPNELNLECVSGIKVLSMGLILASHALLFLISGPVLNTEFYTQAATKFENAILTNNPLLVDTYLLLGGFLMCRLLLIELEKRKGRVNFLAIYLARYLRLTPSYIVVLGLYCTYLSRMSNGPLWDHKMTLEKERCLNSWWTNLLYINNYVNTDYLCMFQSWYLAVDTQLFVVAPIFIYPLWKWRRTGKLLLGVAALVTLLVPFVYTYIYRLDPTLIIYAPELEDISKNHYFVTAYIKTHMRANSYFLGLVMGYIVHRIQSAGSKIPSSIIKTGWLLAAIFGIGSMYSVVVFYWPEHEYNSIEAAFYAALHRMAWCMSIGWVILVCITDNAAMVNKFLSWKVFTPFARLTYCMYLVNGIIELYSYGTIRAPIYMSVYSLASIVLSHIVLTVALAFIVCVLFESPIHGLEKILLRRDKFSKNTANTSGEE